MALDQIALVLGLLTAGGGTAGYVRTQSVPSIVAGLTVGGLYLLSGYRVRNGLAYGAELGLAASVILAGAAVPRAIKSGGKPVPLVLCAIASVGLYSFAPVVYKLKKT